MSWTVLISSSERFRELREATLPKTEENAPHEHRNPNKSDAGNDSFCIWRFINASRSPSPDPKRCHGNEAMIPTLEEISAKVAALPRAPVAFEARWYGDSHGWRIALTAILKSDNWPGFEDSVLFESSLGDIRIFNGQVPPWPEAGIAAKSGGDLAIKFDVPFYFPSPNHPEEDCPRWWEQKKGSPCRRCGIPLDQEDTLPWKGRCYFCFLAEDRSDEPLEQRVKHKRWWQFWRAT